MLYISTTYMMYVQSMYTLAAHWQHESYSKPGPAAGTQTYKSTMLGRLAKACSRQTQTWHPCRDPPKKPAMNDAWLLPTSALSV